MRRIILALLLSLVAVSAFAADANDADRAALLKIHEQEREAHLKGDAALLLASMAPKVTELRNGKVETVDRAFAQQNMAQFMQKVKYTVWEDMQPPVIQISPDGKMAWMIAAVKGEVASASAPDKKQQFLSSWIATYEKDADGWRMTAIAPTIGSAPPPPTLETVPQSTAPEPQAQQAPAAQPKPQAAPAPAQTAPAQATPQTPPKQ